MTRTQPPVSPHEDRIRQLSKTRQRILTIPGDQAMAVILDHPQPAALVHSFPEEDLHFLIHDIGVSDALPLITLASNRQWEYLLDMETWKKDQLDYQQATQWLQLMLRADPERLMRWCFDERLEFLELYLFRNIEIRVREADQDPSDFGPGYFTDDDTLYVRFVDYPMVTPEEETLKAHRNDMLGHLLRRLSIYDHPRYQGLLMEAVSIIPAEIEEELYRLRNVRLAEKGFLPFHEAVGVYQPLRPEDLQGKGRKVLRQLSPGETQFPVPQFAASFLDRDNLFVRALKNIRAPHVIQQLQSELASLCNQVIAADQKTIRSRGQLKSVVSKVSGYLNIGLELMTKSDAEKRVGQASALLQQHLLADLFRTGYAGALQLKWRAVRWRKNSWCLLQQVDLTFWDEAWLGLLGGLLIDAPRFYDPSDSHSSYRDFQTLEEIKKTGKNLDQVVLLDQLMIAMNVPVAPFEGSRLLTYKNFLLTLWARAALNLTPICSEMSTASISLSDFREFFSTLWTTHKGRRFIGDRKKGEFLQWMADASGQSPADLSGQLRSVFEALFNEIEREMAPVKESNLDPRHIHLFFLNP